MNSLNSLLAGLLIVVGNSPVPTVADEVVPQVNHRLLIQVQESQIEISTPQPASAETAADGQERVTRVICDTFKMAFKQKDRQSPQQLLLFGGDVRIDGGKYRVQASRVSFDMAADRFLIYSQGNEKARLWRTGEHATEHSELSAERIEFSPSQNELRVERGQSVFDCPAGRK